MKGITVILTVKEQTGTDGFGQPVYKETPKEVSDVLVGEPSTIDVETNLTMYGKKVAYTLAIPKGNTDSWEDTKVTLPAPFEGTYQTIGSAIAGIEENLPLRWNKKVHLERFEG